MKRLLLLVAVAVSLCACSHTLKTAVKNGKIAPSFNDTLLTSDFLWVRGFGAPNAQHASDSQRRIMSREAAIAHAYQRAGEVLYGTDLEAHAQVIDAVASGSTINTSTQGLISHMELISTEYLEDGGCSVIMRLPRAYLQQAGIDPEKEK